MSGLQGKIADAVKAKGYQVVTSRIKLLLDSGECAEG
nr:hypothetical protein pHum4b_000308 [Escherichia coli]